MNALLPLLHALVVVIAVGAAVAATSPRAAVIQSAPSISKHGLDFTQQIQVIIHTRTYCVCKEAYLEYTVLFVSVLVGFMADKPGRCHLFFNVCTQVSVYVY